MITDMYEHDDGELCLEIHKAQYGDICLGTKREVYGRLSHYWSLRLRQEGKGKGMKHQPGASDSLYRLNPIDFVADGLKSQLPMALHTRIDRAIDIARGEGGYSVSQVFLESINGPIPTATWSVTNGEGTTYTINTGDKTCTCPDFETVKMGWCKHRLAVRLVALLAAENADTA